MSANGDSNGASAAVDYEDEARLQKVANFLRSGKGLAVKTAIEKMPGERYDTERRVDYFKGATKGGGPGAFDAAAALPGETPRG